MVAADNRSEDEVSMVEFVIRDPRAAPGEAPLPPRGIVFVCDVSGSMNATTLAPAGFVRAGHAEALEAELREAKGHLQAAGLDEAEVTAQLAQMRRSLSSGGAGSYISRLEGLQAAIRAQTAGLKAGHPESRVALVTFSDDVAVRTEAGVKRIAGDLLRDAPGLVAAGVAVATTHSKAASEGADELDRIVTSLEPGGLTALGPAVLVGIGMASEMGAGSRVVVITDGMANTVRPRPPTASAWCLRLVPPLGASAWCLRLVPELGRPAGHARPLLGQSRPLECVPVPGRLGTPVALDHPSHPLSRS